MSPIKTVLFDLGNVLVDVDLCAFWNNLGFFRTAEMAPFADGYASLTRQYETGDIGTADYLSGLRIVFNKKFTSRRLQRAFSSIIQQPIAEISEIISRISCAYQTALVSNTNEIHYKLSRTKLESLRMLQKHYLSYQLHVMKPEAGFYDAIIQDQGIIPSELLFIDDLAENVQAAKIAGMQTIQFKSPGHLRTALQSLHVL
ncbi:MAG: HAD family hydrolase [Smithellaceae bacterium]